MLARECCCESFWSNEEHSKSHLASIRYHRTTIKMVRCWMVAGIGLAIATVGAIGVWFLVVQGDKGNYLRHDAGSHPHIEDSCKTIKLHAGLGMSSCTWSVQDGCPASMAMLLDDGLDNAAVCTEAQLLETFFSINMETDDRGADELTYEWCDKVEGRYSFDTNKRYSYGMIIDILNYKINNSTSLLEERCVSNDRPQRRRLERQKQNEIKDYLDGRTVLSSDEMDELVAQHENMLWVGRVLEWDKPQAVTQVDTAHCSVDWLVAQEITCYRVSTYSDSEDSGAFQVAAGSVGRAKQLAHAASKVKRELQARYVYYYEGVGEGLARPSVVCGLGSDKVKIRNARVKLNKAEVEILRELIEIGEDELYRDLCGLPTSKVPSGHRHLIGSCYPWVTDDVRHHVVRGYFAGATVGNSNYTAHYYHFHGKWVSTDSTDMDVFDCGPSSYARPFLKDGTGMGGPMRQGIHHDGDLTYRTDNHTGDYEARFNGRWTGRYLTEGWLGRSTYPHEGQMSVWAPCTNFYTDYWNRWTVWGEGFDSPNCVTLYRNIENYANGTDFTRNNCFCCECTVYPLTTCGVGYDPTLAAGLFINDGCT